MWMRLRRAIRKTSLPHEFALDLATGGEAEHGVRQEISQENEA